MAFSGLDVVGTVLRVPAAIEHWDVTKHLEWWAGRYQYSSMTTQLFWVPNHALGAWLGIGLLCRQRGADAVDALLPMTVVAVALWSPLAALGLVPFVLLRVWQVSIGERSSRLFHPGLGTRTRGGARGRRLLTLDAGRIPKGWTIGHEGFGPGAIAEDLWRQAEFFLLEAGLLGLAILSIRRSAAVVLALCVLAVLPVVSFGGANDFVMRVSIPSLTVLAIGACLALFALRRRRGPRHGGARQASIQAGGVGRAAAAGRGHALPGVRARGDPRCVARESRRHADRCCVRDLPGALRRAARGPADRGVVAVAARVACACAGAGPDASGSCENPALRLERRRAEGLR